MADDIDPDYIDPDALAVVLEAIVMGGLVRRALGRQRPSEESVQTVLRNVFSSLTAPE